MRFVLAVPVFLAAGLFMLITMGLFKVAEVIQGDKEKGYEQPFWEY